MWLTANTIFLTCMHCQPTVQQFAGAESEWRPLWAPTRIIGGQGAVRKMQQTRAICRHVHARLTSSCQKMCVLFEHKYGVSYDMSALWLTEARKDNKCGNLSPAMSTATCRNFILSPAAQTAFFCCAATDYPDHVYMLLPDRTRPSARTQSLTLL
jgi:hypothetical protein